MQLSILEILRCPQTGTRLSLEPLEEVDGEIHSGWLVSTTGDHRYPIRDFIPRFTPQSNYADSFGVQWKRFSKTQLDTHSGLPISADRFWASTAWCKEELKGRWVLDVGCGAGRFAEVALDAGANVVALDYSNAVEACYANLERPSRLAVVQGDIYELPFAKGSFDFVYSLGVLQHTPAVGKAFACLPAMLAPGGKLCVDFYVRSWKNLVQPKYWLRPFTTRMPSEKLFSMLQAHVPRLLRISDSCAAIPMLGSTLRRLVPVANYRGVYGLSSSQVEEWALLDTFDWLSPAYDQPQTPKTIHTWLKGAGLCGIEVLKAGHLVGRGHRPLNGTLGAGS